VSGLKKHVWVSWNVFMMLFRWSRKGVVIIDEGMVVSWLHGRGIMYQLISNRTFMAKWGSSVRGRGCIG
jgi:hypothetical protein